MKIYLVLHDEGEYGYLCAGRMYEDDDGNERIAIWGSKCAFLRREDAESYILSKEMRIRGDCKIVETEVYG